jgi:hypothetical protein
MPNTPSFPACKYKPPIRIAINPEITTIHLLARR